MTVGTVCNASYHGQPSNAAILLFGKAPQRFILTSEVKCLHFHGVEVRKPIPSYQVYKGVSFQLFARYIERAGTGTLDMIALSKDAGLKPPEFPQDGGQFVQTLWRPPSEPASGVSEPVTPKVAPKVAPEVAPEVTPEVARLLRVVGEPLSRQDLQDQLGLRDDEHFRKAYLLPALAVGVIGMTVPDRPTSRLQKYRISAKGRAWLTQKEEKKKKK